MLEAAKAFIVRTTDWRSPALLIFRRRLPVVSLMTYAWPPPSVSLGACGLAPHQARPWLSVRVRLGLDSGLGLALALDAGVQILAGSPSGSGFRLGLERIERLAGDFNDRLTILIAQLVRSFESLRTLPPGCSPPPVGRRAPRPPSGRAARDRRVPRSTPARQRSVQARTPARLPPV